MEDLLTPFLLIAVIVMLMFVIPVVNTSDKVDDVIMTVVDDAATEFVDRTRAQGYITYDDYQQLTDVLISTGNAYNVNVMLMSVKYMSDDEEDYNAAFVTDSHREITEALINLPEGGRYQMKAGDYLRIQITQTSRNAGQRFKEVFFRTQMPNNFIRYGGRVGNEDVL